MWMEYVKSDLGRYVGQENIRFKPFVKQYLFNPGFKFTFWLRLNKYTTSPALKMISQMQWSRLSRKYMLHISPQMELGYGFYIGHGGCVVISPTARIGNNVNVSQFTTIGSNNKSAATIGDNVYIGPNVCIVERVTIGDNVTIGAGSVVTKDIAANTVAAGVPAKAINSYNADNQYIKNGYRDYCLFK